jgi:hypothetical protein
MDNRIRVAASITLNQVTGQTGSVLYSNSARSSVDAASVTMLADSVLLKSKFTQLYRICA